MKNSKQYNRRFWGLVLLLVVFVSLVILANTLTTYIFIRDANKMFIEGEWREVAPELTDSSRVDSAAVDIDANIQ